MIDNHGLFKSNCFDEPHNSGANRVISNCFLPLAWELKCTKHYEHDDLMVIAENMDHLYFTLAPNTIATVRQVRLNKTRCGKRGSKLKKQFSNPITHQAGINFHNIMGIRRCSMITRKLFHLSGPMAHCQSIWNKDLIVHEHLVANNLEFAILTETWLMDNFDDTVWCVTSSHQNCGFKLLTSNHNSRRDGGLAIVYKDGLEVDLIQEGELPSFHFAIWRIKSWNQCFFAISIYRPPYIPSNHWCKFITEFAEWFSYITTQYKNTIVLGDLNFHVNDNMDVNANIFQDTMAATCLAQWVDFPPHRLGNALDLVFTECSSNITITSCTRAHCGQITSQWKCFSTYQNSHSHVKNCSIIKLDP